MSVEISITDQIVEINEVSNPVEISVSAGAIIAPVWGGITGTLSNQTDLQNALNAKFDDPTGTTAQYLRGDGSLATFPSFPVTSVFGRTGSVVATEGDYTLTQLGDVTLTSPTNGQVLKYNGTSWVNNTDTDTGLTSVGLTMPSAFSVANSPLTSNGTLAVSGAGTASQYIRGDGQLANFPDNQGGGSSVNYYLNGSVTQGTFGGDTYYEMSKTPILGAGTNFTRTNGQGNGYIASFITDAGDPSLLNIPAGNWNVEFYFQSSASGGSPQFYGELYKVDASNNFTLVGSGSANPEGITNGTTVDQYFTSIPVPQTSLLVTDRLAIRIYVIPSGRTITLHTENSNLCEVLTTLSTGLNALNGLTSQVQYFATGTSGTDFAISSATDTHTFNLPTASATNRGALSSADWTTFNSKIGGTASAGQVAYFTGATTQAGSNNLFWDNTNGRLGIGTNTPTFALSILRNENTSSGYEIQNNSTGTSANAGIIVRNSASAGQLFKLSTGYVTYKTLVANDLGFYNGTSGDISLLNDVAAGKIKFLTGTASVAQMTLTANGRLLLGSTTEGTQILQVTGTSLLNGNTQFGGFLSNTSAGSPLEVRANVAATTSFAVYYSSALSAVSGTYNILTTSGQQFTPTSGTAVFNSFVSNVTINQTGGANGITRGLYVNPTLTAAADWRSIEWSNNSGWGLRGEGTAPNYLAGNLLIGSTNNFSKLYVGGVTSTTTSQTFIFSQPSITGALTDLYSFNSNILGNLTVNVTNAHHFRASQSGLSTSTITNQYGFFVDSSLVGATNNFGFYGNIASGTNRWNLYMNGTADNYMAGSLGIGQTTLTGYNLRISNNITGITSPIAVFVDGTIQATATGANQIFRSSPSVVASATISEIRHFSALQGTFGAGSTVSTQTGFFVHSGMTGATTDYGFYGDLAAATNVWNLYMNGTANNYLNGSLLIGSTTDSGEKLQVTGTMKVTGASSFGSNLTTSGFFSKTNSAVAIQTALWGVAQNVGGADNGTAITLGVDNTTAYGQMQLAFDNLTSGTRTSFRFLTNDGSTLSERVRFDWRGNIGLGITPSAWGITNSTRALQMNAGTMWSFGSSSVFLGQNYFYNGSARVYYTTAAATEYAQISGAHIWYNAPSGTAGNAITFTQAMTLDASGNLLVGGTSVYGATITSYGSSTRSGGMGIRNSAGTIAGFYGTYAAGSGSGSTDILVESAGFMLFSAAGAERMRLTATNGNLHIGTFTADSGEKLQVTGTAKITSKLSIGAGTTSNAQINLASSTAPTSPNNGDIWFDGTNIKIQVGGVTRTFTLI